MILILYFLFCGLGVKSEYLNDSAVISLFDVDTGLDDRDQWDQNVTPTTGLLEYGHKHNLELPQRRQEPVDYQADAEEDPWDNKIPAPPLRSKSSAASILSPKDKKILNQMTNQVSSESDSHEDHRDNFLNDVFNKLKSVNKFPDFESEIERHKEKYKGQILKNWERDAEDLEKYARHLYKAGLKEKKIKTLREAAEKSIQRSQKKTPIDPSPGMAMYWPEEKPKEEKPPQKVVPNKYDPQPVIDKSDKSWPTITAREYKELAISKLKNMTKDKLPEGITLPWEIPTTAIPTTLSPEQQIAFEVANGKISELQGRQKLQYLKQAHQRTQRQLGPEQGPGPGPGGQFGPGPGYGQGRYANPDYGMPQGGYGGQGGYGQPRGYGSGNGGPGQNGYYAETHKNWGSKAKMQQIRKAEEAKIAREMMNQGYESPEIDAVIAENRYNTMGQLPPHQEESAMGSGGGMGMRPGGGMGMGPGGGMGMGPGGGMEMGPGGGMGMGPGAGMGMGPGGGMDMGPGGRMGMGPGGPGGGMGMGPEGGMGMGPEGGMGMGPGGGMRPGRGMGMRPRGRMGPGGGMGMSPGEMGMGPDAEMGMGAGGPMGMGPGGGDEEMSPGGPMGGFPGGGSMGLGGRPGTGPMGIRGPMGMRPRGMGPGGQMGMGPGGGMGMGPDESEMGPGSPMGMGPGGPMGPDGSMGMSGSPGGSPMGMGPNRMGQAASMGMGSGGQMGPAGPYSQLPYQMRPGGPGYNGAFMPVAENKTEAILTTVDPLAEEREKERNEIHRQMMLLRDKAVESFSSGQAMLPLQNFKPGGVQGYEPNYDPKYKHLRSNVTKLPAEDDFGSPIRWVPMMDKSTSDGLAKVTDPKNGKNRRYEINSPPPITTKAPSYFMIEPQMKTVLRSINVDTMDDRDWLAIEAIMGGRASEPNCDGEFCQSRCHGDTCGSGCISNGCTAMCEGTACDSRCDSFNCYSTNNQHFRMSMKTFQQQYPQYPDGVKPGQDVKYLEE